MKKTIIGLLLAFTMVLSAQISAPLASVLKGQTRDNFTFLQTVPQFFTYTHTAMTVEDTLLTNFMFKKKIWIESINIVVTDTVESQGDSCYYRIWVGANKILEQKTSAFKPPGGFTFTTLEKVTSSINSRLYVGITNTTSGQTSGITEGTFKIYIRYWNL